MKEIAQLDQTTRLKGKRQFTLRDDGILRVSHAEAGRHQEYSVEVAQLDPEPVRDKRRATAMIAGMSAFGLLAGACVFAAVTSGRGRHGDEVYVFGVFAAFLSLPFLLCVYQYFKQSYDVVVFQSPFTTGRIAFLNNIPSAEVFAGFIDRLRSEIRTHRDKLPSLPKSLSQELEALAKLRESGILSEAEFATAKQNLINSNKGSGPLGFGTR